MKAVVFAAGLGTRLRPLTNEIPKALVPVAGTPALERVIHKLECSGFDDIIVNVHHRAEQIARYLIQRKGIANIFVSDESEHLLDTGGGLLRALTIWENKGKLQYEEPVLVHNADIITDFSLEAMVATFKTRHSDILLFCQDRNSSRKLLFNDHGALSGWENCTTGQTIPPNLNPQCFNPLAFGGVHLIKGNIINSLNRYSTIHGEAFPIIPFYLEVKDQYTIDAYLPRDKYLWHDIGTIEKLRNAEKDLK